MNKLKNKIWNSQYHKPELYFKKEDVKSAVKWLKGDLLRYFMLYSKNKKKDKEILADINLIINEAFEDVYTQNGSSGKVKK